LQRAGRVLRRSVLSCGLLLTAAGALPAQQLITNVGLVDLQVVTTAYFRESTAVRDLYADRDRIDAERARLEVQIFELEARKLRAEQDGRNQEALRIADQLFAQKQHLRDFVSVMNRQLSQRQALLAESDAFLGELAAAIEFVAESRGLSLVLDKNNVTLLYFLPEIDITELVIAELGRRAGRN
jgi:Skp family chaperone for outer membrane proteins